MATGVHGVARVQPRAKQMKITEADIVWSPASADVDAGSIRVERHGSKRL
jgi:hypothetical protein